MNKRPVTVFYKLAIFLATMGFGANSQKDMQNVALIISSKTLPENDDSAAFDSILQIGHCFLCNGVQQEF